MKTQLLRGRNAKMQECRSARAQKCIKMTVFCVFALLHFCITFAQTPAPDFTDPRDGETYKTVIMPDGKRWMAENLRYRKGLDNSVFSNNTTANTFAALKNTYFCPGSGPLNVSANQADPLACDYWGCLYPWWTANVNIANTGVNSLSGQQGICPPNWHLPSDNEWAVMLNSVETGTKNHNTMGTANYGTRAGALLKDTARGSFNDDQAYKKYWTGSAIPNDNIYGFSVLAAGMRTSAGAFSGNGTQALFWTSNVTTLNATAVSRRFDNTLSTVYRNSVQSLGDALAVRCVEGVCKDSFPIVFAAIPASCENIPIWNEIGVLTGTKTRTYNLSVPASIGNWTYAVSVKSYTTSSAPTVSISGNGTASASVKFTITSPIVDKTFTILITATNPIYCGQLSETHVFTLKEVPVLTTIAGNEAVGAIKTMTDVRDCKVYSIIKMADGKWWMRENLNYQAGLTFRSTVDYFATMTNGTPGIGNFWCPGADLATSSTLSMCDTWGALYTWECVMSKDGVGSWSEPSASQMYAGSGSGNPASVSGRGICPPGWHVPSDREWGDMLNAVETGTKNHNTVLSGTWAGTNAGTTLKSSGFTTGTKQTTGFSVIASGCRSASLTIFSNRNVVAYFCSASSVSASNAWRRQFQPEQSGVYRLSGNRASGFSVRCTQD